MKTKYSFFHDGEWHYSAQPELDATERQKKWEFLRTHEIKHFYQTNEELLTSARIRGLTLINKKRT